MRTLQAALGPSTRLRFIASFVVMLLVLAACGGEDPEPVSDQEETSGDEDPIQADAEDGEESEDGGEPPADGVLEPLADGWPDRPLTLWQASDPGHPDDLFNQLVAEVAREYSPVPVNTDTHNSGPTLQFGLVEFLETQPGFEDAYDIFTASWMGNTMRVITLDLLEDTDMEVIYPLNHIAAAPYVMITNPDSGFATLEELEAAARESPGELSFVGSGTGSAVHSSMMVWQSQADLELRFIPTDSITESRNVILGEGADVGMTTYVPGIEDQFNVLLQTADERSAGLPDVPTSTELGYNIPAGTQRGFGTSRDVAEAHPERIEWWNELFRRVAADPAFEAGMEGFEIEFVGHDEAAALRRNIIDTFEPILREAGLLPD